jgi:pyridoxal phosphate enzyme (YggS family)
MSEIIENNVKSIRKRIATAAQKSGRTEADILLVAVSKMQPLEKVYQAYHAGIEYFGENKVQDLVKKIFESEYKLKWHMVGHLQSNKINKVVGNVEMIESVDSIQLLDKLDIASQNKNLATKVLLQVNTSHEETKFGFSSDEVIEACERAENLSHIEIQGLMTIGPFTDDIQKVVKSFRSLKELSDRIESSRSTKISMKYISMGMTGDFEIAIEEGSNLVRIGTAIFGPRM